jgi:hypothetical protein
LFGIVRSDLFDNSAALSLEVIDEAFSLFPGDCALGACDTGELLIFTES